MSYWYSTEASFGTILQGGSTTVRFKAKVDIPPILEIKAGCGCTQPQYNPITRILTVKYQAGLIPDQHIGNELVSRKLTVHYADGSTEKLVITGVKVR
jgi:hypothetical protein